MTPSRRGLLGLFSGAAFAPLLPVEVAATLPTLTIHPGWIHVGGRVVKAEVFRLDDDRQTIVPKEPLEIHRGDRTRIVREADGSYSLHVVPGEAMAA